MQHWESKTYFLEDTLWRTGDWSPCHRLNSNGTENILPNEKWNFEVWWEWLSTVQLHEVFSMCRVQNTQASFHDFCIFTWQPAKSHLLSNISHIWQRKKKPQIISIVKKYYKFKIKQLLHISTIWHGGRHKSL